MSDVDIDELAELRRLVGVLGVSSHWIASELEGAGDRLVRRWIAGKIPVPPEVNAWLRLLELAREARPTVQREWFGRK